MTARKTSSLFFKEAMEQKTDECIVWPFYVMPNGRSVTQWEM